MSVETSEQISGAVILAAGNGTRMSPATKAVRKPLVPVYNRNVIDYSVEDCLRAGITDFDIVVDKKAKKGVRELYGKRMSPEAYVAERGDLPQLQGIKELGGLITFRYLEQPMGKKFFGFGKPHPYGTGAAAAMAADRGTVVITTADDFVYNPMGESAAGSLIRGVRQLGATAGLLTYGVSDEAMSNYGVVESEGGVFRRILDRPTPDMTDSRQANISLYLVDSELMNHILNVSPAANGEYQLTEGLNTYSDAGNKLAVVAVSEGRYLDSGTPDNYVESQLVVRDGVHAQLAA